MGAAARDHLKNSREALVRADRRSLLVSIGLIGLAAGANAAEPAWMLVCGRYEGFDERVRGFVDEEISLGDFVMTGGEVEAMAMIEATVRLVPGVLGNADASCEESHGENGLLE